MKAEDRLETVESKQTGDETVSLRCCLTFVKEKLTLFNEIVVDEIKMSRNTLISIKIWLFIEYIGITLLLYIILSNSWVVNGRIECMDSAGRELNGTESLILSSLCRNPNYRTRFSSIFALFESMSMVLMLAKLVLAIKKIDDTVEGSLSMKLHSKAVFFMLFIPRSLLYLVLPLQSLMTATFSFHFGSLLAILRAPIMLFFSLTATLITLPISVFFPYPLNDSVEADFSNIGDEGRTSEKDPSSTPVTIHCFERCRLNFEWTWLIPVLFFFLNFAFVYWFLGFTEKSQDAISVEGRVLDSRENFSDGVEFIRVSEVSEDFSYEDEEESKNCLKGMKDFEEEEEKSKRVDEDFDRINNSERLGTGDAEEKEPVVLVASQAGNEEVREKSIAEKDSVKEEVIENHLSTEGELTVTSKRDTEVVDGRDETKGSVVRSDVKEHLKEVSLSNKGTQTFCLKLHKGCQTFVPIHLHKKINKKTQVSPIFVDAQTNTDVISNGEGTSTQKFDVSQSENGRVNCSKAVDENGVGGFRNHQNGDTEKRSKEEELNVREKRENGKIAESEKENIAKTENDRKNLEFSPDSNILIEANGHDRKEKFGFPELTIIPGTHDFERRILRKNQIERINVEAFLKCLEKEDERDVVFVEKDLLIDTFRNIVLTTKASTTEDAVCPRSNDVVDECECRIHGLIKKFTKQNQQSDEVDGLKMETEDDDCSDDESFFSGFRL